MRTAEEPSGTVLHRLIQEHLRYRNSTDTSTLLAIQQQALRGGSNSSGGGGTGSPRSSLESLTQEESQFIHMSTRQDPQGQEYKGDYNHCESDSVCHLYQLHRHGEELPTYEEAKAHSQYLASVGAQQGQPQLGLRPEMTDHQGDVHWDLKRKYLASVGAQQGQPQLGLRPEMTDHQGDVHWDLKRKYLASVGAQQGQPQLGLRPEMTDHQGDVHWDLKRKHARSLSERLMQLSLERSCGDIQPLSSSHSYPQLSNGHSGPVEHQGTEFLQYPDQRGPPPDYPFLVKPPGYMLSHSQETHGHYHQDPPPSFQSQNRYVPSQPQAELVRHSVHMSHSNPSTHNDTAQMDLLRENERLRKELKGYSEKAARLQKLEVEIQRISEAYETLMKGSAKRETLEKTMRNKLESEIKRLHDFNRDLRDRLDTVTKQQVVKEEESADKKQQVFTKLLEQNEEQQREVQRLRGSGEVLEQALGSAQARNLALEEELRRKRAYVEKVKRLQSSLGQLQAACEKREALELRLRTRLEQELKSLRSAQSHSTASGPGSLPSAVSSMVSVQQQLAEREERILALEADITHWEQKYLEESTMRQFAMDAAATAAAQRDSSIIKHSPNNSFNDHLPTSHRHQEMENRVRALHSQLLEKDAVIRVLQQRSGREQNRLEQQALRPARSVPSISTEQQALRPARSVPSISTEQHYLCPARSVPSISTEQQALRPAWSVPSISTEQHYLRPARSVPSISTEQQALRPARSVPSISTEQQDLRPARSIPSINTDGPVEQPTRGKGWSLSDDQTVAAMSPLSLPPHQHPCAPLALPALLFLSKPQSRDCSTQCDRDVLAQETDLTVDPTSMLAPAEASSTSTPASGV
ncbi:angiomotin-like 2a isoform X2 [Salvelinus namaycush]|uniref:Angiomotin-like 2a isoform X2 n=1 Tax=Salvelinus namaycush TaxID=8040 RepID=A0A8U1EQH4_SALNM|nr:angiomotin-like 2a isoform X2 [Salvelinus namaycush]